ncbi:AAA ATPase [Puttea exsequens]|nr:AAA ATPase [Puttea exsequens]
MDVDESHHSLNQKSTLPAKHPLRKNRTAPSPRKANAHGRCYEEEVENDVEKFVQLPTPKTPRYRDALSKRVPITPRHKVGLVGKPLTPRTPRTPFTPSNTKTVYNYARQLFARSADPRPIIGREDERTELHAFISKGIESKNGRCMYVSGPPGTGKSALVSEVCSSIQDLEGVKMAYINCMSAKSSRDIYGKLMQEFLGPDYQIAHDEMAHLKTLFTSKMKSSGIVYVVTLDEIDHLLTLDLEILYTLFEWSLHRFSNLVIIGIANALDLTDRFLPKLKARNLKPQLLPFLPYTAPQIASVITSKLKALCPEDPTNPGDHVPFLHPAAIQLCSKKVASQTGDLRKAFDIVRGTIDLIEAETKQKHQLQQSPSKAPLGENPNLSSPNCLSPATATCLASLTSITAPRATIAHISRVAAAALSNGTTQRLQILNLQQKAALCALISHQKTARKTSTSIFSTPSKKSAAPSIMQLYVTYSALCKRENALHPLTSTEFADVISGLETLGLLGEEKGGRGFGGVSRTPSRKGGCENKRVLSFVDEDEMKGCLDGIGGGILRALLTTDE